VVDNILPSFCQDPIGRDLTPHVLFDIRALKLFSSDILSSGPF